MAWELSFGLLAVFAGADGRTIAVIVAVGAGAGIVSLVARVPPATRHRRPAPRLGRPGHHPGHRRADRGDRRAPAPLSYWYALVPFEDGPGEKERPVLVLRQDGDVMRVLKVTSQDRSGRPSYRRIDTSGWDRPGVRDASWLRTDRQLTIPLAGFRRRLGNESNNLLLQELRRLHPREFA